MKKLFAMTLCLMMGVSLFGCKEETDGPSVNKTYRIPKNGVCVVGTDIDAEDITEFYYTVDAPLAVSFYQRYRFYTEDGKHLFFHETREGGSWPMDESYTTKSGTVELSEQDWNAFFEILKNGTVRAREEDLSTGGSGPWLYLYWKGDQGKYQEFTFADYGSRLSFEAYCEALADR